MAGLFTAVPLGPQLPVATQAVGSDGRWAFDLTALDAGGSSGLYYVEIAAQFGAASVSRTVGPLSPGAPVAVSVLPVQIEVIESRVAGGAMQVRSATAHVFDPATGAEILDGTASITIAVGTMSVPMPWDDAGMRYVATPSPSPVAQSSYVVTIAQPALGSAPTTWSLAAVEPASDGTITSPANDASVAAGPLTVTWDPVPGVDYVQLEVFEGASMSDGGAMDAAPTETDAQSPSDAGAGGGSPSPTYTLVYSSPRADAPTVTQETVPAGALTVPGPYLINVISSQANCPPGQSGCVYAGTVAAETIALVVSDGGGGPDAGP